MISGSTDDAAGYGRQAVKSDLRRNSMSAIAGIVASRSRPDAARLVGSMCEIQAHRGSQGRIMADLPGACMGACRFCAGHENCAGTGAGGFPEETEFTIAYDGVLYNGSGLKSELGLGNGGSEEFTDEEIILKSYLKWGSDCVARLDGIFGFAIWDCRNRLLFAARDRFGEKPFFYATGPDGEFLFASEIKALLATGIVSRELDYEAIYHFLHEKGFIPPRTPLKKVRSLLPGHWLLWHDGDSIEHVYWDIPCHSSCVGDIGEALSGYSQLLHRAASKRIKGRGTPGLIYSGGIDSSLLLAIMAEETDRKIWTFTVTTNMSEEQLRLSRNAAERFDTEHVEVDLNSGLLADHTLEFARGLSTPITGSFLLMACNPVAKEMGVDTIMTGCAADTTLQADLAFRKMMRVEKIARPLCILPEKMRTALYDHALSMVRKAFLKGRYPVNRYMKALDLYLRNKRGVTHWCDTKLMPDQILYLFDPDIPRRDWRSPCDIYRDLYRSYPDKDLDDRMLYALYKTFHYFAASNYESLGAANSINVHTPFLDKDLVEYSRRLPFSIRCYQGKEKYIIKELCRSHISSAYADQGKCPFRFPLKEWLAGDLRMLVDDILSPSAVSRRGLFDQVRVAKLYGDMCSGRSDVSCFDVWSLVILEMWLRANRDEPVGAAA